MAKLTALCCLLALGWLCNLGVEAYPIGDLSLDGLLYGFRELTHSRGRRQAATDPCTYPGLVAITVNNKVVNSGIYQANNVRIPTDALTLLEISNLLFPLVVYADGTAQAQINAGQLAAHTVRNPDGTSSVSLSTAFSSASCGSVTDAIIYQGATMDIDVSTCKVVSFLGDQPLTSAHVFDGVLRLDPLAQNNMIGCCADVLPNILKRTGQLGNPPASAVASSFTCIKSTQGICVGGIGSPIYCKDNRSGQQVVVGLVDSGTCQAGEYVGVIDFTQGSLAGFSS